MASVSMPVKWEKGGELMGEKSWQGTSALRNYYYISTKVCSIINYKEIVDEIT